MNCSKIEQIRSKLEKIENNHFPDENDSIREYLSFYSLLFDKCRSSIGAFKYKNYSIAAYLFQPKTSRGTIYIVHGYFDHTTYLSNLISHLVNNGYTVIAMDLPGHGLSTGEKYSINSFSEYGECFKTLIDLTSEYKKNGSFHAIGFSTGCSTIFEYLNSYNDCFDKIIFIAPLIRSVAWRISKIGNKLTKKWPQKIKRLKSKDSKNKDFLQFRKKDPLQSKYICKKWVDELFKWDKKISAYAVIKKELKIIQGLNDKTVDWKFNLPFLESKFDKVSIEMIEGAGHQLLNESEQIVNPILHHIDEILK